jgi:saccharopine dehydrogenase (NAD+, L-lysine forming)
VSELCRCSGAGIVVAGRDSAKAQTLAKQFGDKVSAATVDVFDDSVLDAFCQRCSVIINCAGPVMLLQDRVAQAAFRNRCHYVDAAGLSFVKERLSSHAKEIEDFGLSFVISAGWMPGLSELVPAYAVAQARAKMDTIESVTLCFGDSGEWSENALHDAALFVRRSGLRSPGYFHKGEWTRAKMSVAFRKIDLGNPIGSRRFALVSMPELNEIGRHLRECDFFPYAYLSGLRTAIGTTAIAIVPLPEAVAVRLMRNAFRRNHLPVDGFAWAQVIGKSGEDKLTLTVQIVYRDRRDYWIHGVTLATVGRMISEGKGIKVGVHFLADAADPVSLMRELRKAGIDEVESWSGKAEVLSGVN